MNNDNWIDVNDRLPEKRGMVMTFRLPDGECQYAGIGLWDWDESEGFEFMVNEFGTVTHWQPLPAPPTKGE